MVVAQINYVGKTKFGNMWYNRKTSGRKGEGEGADAFLLSPAVVRTRLLSGSSRGKEGCQLALGRQTWVSGWGPCPNR